jgi:hypothetical protein
MAEANEPPADALRRELREELGLDIQVGDLLCVDWVSPHGPWDDLLNFIFDGGTLSDSDINGLRLVDSELAPSSSATRARPRNASGPTSGAGQAPHWKRWDRPGTVSTGRVRLSQHKDDGPRMYLAYTRLVPVMHLPPYRRRPQPH